MTPPTPCPTWCAESAGHPYDARLADDELTRGHSRQVGLMATSSGHLLTVEIWAAESITGAGIIFDPPAIYLPDLDGLEAMTPDDAQALAGLLLEAAAQLAEIQR